MKAPQPPDPYKTAKGQFHANAGTAVVQQMLNMVNQETPFSSLTYERGADQELRDPRTGEVYKIPQFTGRQSSPQLEALINSPWDPSTATADRLTDYGRQFLDPYWQKQRETYEADLLNRGIGMGTEAYDRGMQNFGDQQTRAYNDMFLSGQNQAWSQAMAERQRPINEILAAISGTPLGATPAASIGAPDYAGAVQANYQQRLANHMNNVNAIGQLVGTVARAGMGGWGGAP